MRKLLLGIALLSACASSPRTTDEPAPLAFEQGASAFPFGDDVAIQSVASSTGAMTVGSTLTVRGSYALVSRSTAKLYLGLTKTGPGTISSTEQPGCALELNAGTGTFELVHTLQAEGFPHVTFYDLESGQPFGGVYFGLDGNVLSQGLTHYANGAPAD